MEYRRRAGSEAVLHGAVREALRALEEETESVGGLPHYWLREVHRFLKCGLLEYGFVRVKCDDCGDEALVAFSCKGRGLCPSCGARRAHETGLHLVEAVLPKAPYRQWTVSFPYALRYRLMKEPGLLEEVLRHVTRLIANWQRRAAKKHGVTEPTLTGAVTQVQYWGSALQLSPHFHTLVPDGVFVERAGALDFVELDAPTPQDVATLVTKLARRVKKTLQRRGLEDAQPEVDDGLDAVRLESLQQALELGRLRTEPEAEVKRHHQRVAMAGGISLHADTWVHANDRQSLERLCRYGARGALAANRLSRREDGKYEYRMKRAVRGRDVLVMTALELLKKLAAVCPPARKHLVHFHGVFGSHAKRRSEVVPAPPPAPVAPQAQLPLNDKPCRARRPRHDWAWMLRKVFAIDVLRCVVCGGRRQVLAAVTDWELIDEALRKRGLEPTRRSPVAPRSHGPPRQAELALAF